MADGLDDEDIFADLYDGDDTVDVAPPATTISAPATAVEEPVPAPAPQPLKQISEVVTEEQTSKSPKHDEPAAFQHGYGDTGASGEQQSFQSMPNNHAQGSWNGHQNEDQDRPLIGSKEDGYV
ncbi:hypothetical protein ANO11243_038490 [Dothideomycetidae sp. 11243]|nr:hypothetical protein ANO11243_038490 [fungal sp. No.11243]